MVPKMYTRPEAVLGGGAMLRRLGKDTPCAVQS